MACSHEQMKDELHVGVGFAVFGGRVLHCVAEDDLELQTLLPLPPECWYFRHIVPALCVAGDLTQHVRHKH